MRCQTQDIERTKPADTYCRHVNENRGGTEMYRTLSKPTARASVGQMDILAQKRLLARLMAHDPVAEEQFIAQHERLVYHIFRSMKIEREDQEDLCQQVFVHLWKDDFRCLRLWRCNGSMTSYLGRIISRIATDHKRQSARKPLQIEGIDSGGRLQSTLPLAEADPAEVVVNRTQWAAIHEAMQDISPRGREVILRKHYHSQSYDQIGQEMGISTSHVGVILNRSKKRLQQVLSQKYPGLFSNSAAAWE